MVFGDPFCFYFCNDFVWEFKYNINCANGRALVVLVVILFYFYNDFFWEFEYNINCARTRGSCCGSEKRACSRDFGGNFVLLLE